MIDDRADNLELDLLGDVPAIMLTAEQELLFQLHLIEDVGDIAIEAISVATPAEASIQAALDFFGPGGAGAVWYRAKSLLANGRVLGGYEEVQEHVRNRCKDLMKSGRCREEGKPRNVAKARQQRAEKAGQLGLFCGGVA